MFSSARQLETIAEEPEFDLLSLPNELIQPICRNFDLASRHALRVNERLAGIEEEVTFRIVRLAIAPTATGVLLTEYSDENSRKGTRVEIALSDLEHELKFLATNTMIEEATYMPHQNPSDTYSILQALSCLKAEKFCIISSKLDDKHLNTIIENKKRVVVYHPRNVTVDGVMRVYEKMLAREGDLSEFTLFVNGSDFAMAFLAHLRSEDRAYDEVAQAMFNYENPTTEGRLKEDHLRIRVDESNGSEISLTRDYVEPVVHAAELSFDPEKIVFAAPYDVKHTRLVKMTNSSTHRIGFTATGSRPGLGVEPATGVLDPEEKVYITVYCDAFAYDHQNYQCDGVNFTYVDAPDFAGKQFRREWLVDQGARMRVIGLDVAYNI